MYSKSSINGEVYIFESNVVLIVSYHLTICEKKIVNIILASFEHNITWLDIRWSCFEEEANNGFYQSPIYI